MTNETRNYQSFPGGRSDVTIARKVDGKKIDATPGATNLVESLSREGGERARMNDAL